ncbi:DNA/RNA non-specific endonuclease [Hymenobacter cellulosilyticus]|uniref:DNA/RNA non-specific endonuclease n=1 Tax=Hymenobacter cellulosilyticus TaxID=2932248 RepID=UPI0035CC1E96
MLPLRRGGTGVELKYQNFSVIMSASRRLPMLTAVNLLGLDREQVDRIDTWYFDGRLDKSDQWGDELYHGNSLDRGHMVRREDPVWAPSRSRLTPTPSTLPTAVLKWQALIRKPGLALRITF